jgi:DNA-binding LacI/PurR family transcriptional regulator
MSARKLKRKRITLTDVAVEAGVSIQTVSHVLANNMTVRLPESTREKVRLAAKKVGYSPNKLAQAMRSGKTNVIGIWMPLDRPVITYIRYLHIINKHARQSGFDLMVTGLDADSALKPEGHLPTIWPVDGIISVDAGKAMISLRKNANHDNIPIVIFGLEEVSNSDSVSWNILQSSRQLTKMLIAQGCTRILHVTMDWVLDDFPNEQRRRGYADEMLNANLEPIFLPVSGESSSEAELAMLQYLKENPAPDAVFGFTDPLAIGAMRAMQFHNIDIPTQCRVWGFGDFPEGEDFKVPLSTIRVPLPLIVKQAWQWLMERIADPTLEHRLVVLPLELVYRDSGPRF